MIKMYATLGTIILVLSINAQESALTENPSEDEHLTENQLDSQDQKVDIKVYYECLCPDTRNFDAIQFMPAIEKLAQYLDIHMYPYGNAETIERDGEYEFRCQHGRAECYGNKLHACALNLIGNLTKAVTFNSCMMASSQKNSGSNDLAADKCGQVLHVDSEAIKQCAKGTRGSTLLKYYGDESMKELFNYVPHILINGVLTNGNNFFRDLCAAFAHQPAPCIPTQD